MASLPRFASLWSHYPDDHDPEAVKRRIGGRVNLPWITNTCTIRMSYALNHSGSPIPKRYPGLTTVEGGDGHWYAIRVRELHAYLKHELEAPEVSGTSKSKSDFEGLEGIMMFDVEGWSDATGHFDVWNGSATKHAEYWALAKVVHLWICP